MCSVHEEQVWFDLPALLPDINFVAPGNYSFYQFIAVAGNVPDLFYSEHGYMAREREKVYPCNFTQTDWLPVNTPKPAGQLIIKGLPPEKPADCSLMAAIGIAFGIAGQ